MEKTYNVGQKLLQPIIIYQKAFKNYVSLDEQIWIVKNVFANVYLSANSA